MTQTLDYYNSSAEKYTQTNHLLQAPLDQLVEFIAQVRASAPPSSEPLRLLDAGSGSGRDTLAMLRAGCQVDAFDGSTEMAAISSNLTGQPTQVMRFESLALPSDHYDGIWAMASLLHVPRSDLPQVFVALGQALKPNGLLHATFKYGNEERSPEEGGGRHFTDMDKTQIQHCLGGITGFEIVGVETTLSSIPQTNPNPWFSAVLRRTGPAPTLKPKARFRP